ncbi:hypothetical protein F5890DRAFT_1181115 [Lentinula detonsa]|uniref:Uncharacterized protein n=1 Tax=Lentinula detonsa TaxID=2804962 RepID=A0AA38PND6_9AGAR|nr:hypothetical protein F5890DRAFT_1181115 [Lentinula detonsa]
MYSLHTLLSIHSPYIRPCTSRSFFVESILFSPFAHSSVLTPRWTMKESTNTRASGSFRHQLGVYIEKSELHGIIRVHSYPYKSRLSHLSAATFKMSSHDDAAVVLTGHVRSDIIILSSLLNGQHVELPTVRRDKTNEKLSLLAYISALLTIGDDGAPFAHSVHAVSGRINPTAIECLVYAQNTGQTSELTQTTAIPAAGELEEILDATNSTRGAELLKRWAQDVNVDEFNQRNYTLRDHLRDIFQILAHLRTCNRNDPAFLAFTHLIHRRAFRKLGWRIEELLTAWALQWGSLYFPSNM